MRLDNIQYAQLQAVELKEPRPSGRSRETSMKFSDVVAIGEVKLGTGADDKRDNELKVTGGATEILYNDPCRRFVNGFTIESNLMRLWHFERSHVWISDSFDFHKEPQVFIQFLLYLLFSSPKELGFDPTVRRYIRKVPMHSQATEQTGDPPQPDEHRWEIAYRYQVGNQFFLAEGPPIYEEAAHRVTSRATRVWRARKMTLPDPTDGQDYELSQEQYVVKDAYLYEDAALESNILGRIMSALRAVEGVDPDTRRKYCEDAPRYFMHYELDEVVKLPNENEDWAEDDLTSDNSANKRTTSTPTPSLRCPHPESACHSSSHHNEFHPRPFNSGAGKTTFSQQALFRRRKHVRTVFTQVCQSMYELDDWETFLRCMKDVTQALYYMRLAGWVHRDISGGNILWDPVASQARLSDLEYARPYEEVGEAHDSRPGTLAFMAVEYQERRYIFNPIANRRKPMDVVKFQQPRNIPRPFAYNFYHDLESLMWLYIWFMIYHPPVHCVPESKLDSGASAEALLAVGDEYFSCGIDGSIPRYKMLEHGWDTIELLMY
ncbi:hypothetical protein CONPUDRAFT_106308, partial [Coniophora puteana RWD-64-598 SS2]